MEGKGWFERGWKGRLWFECLDLVLVFGSCFAVLGYEEGVLSLKVCSLFTDDPVLLCFPSTRKPEEQKKDLVLNKRFSCVCKLAVLVL